MLLQGIQPAPHDGGGHALGFGSRRQTAFGGNGDKGFKGFELVHGSTRNWVKSTSNAYIASAYSYFFRKPASTICPVSVADFCIKVISFKIFAKFINPYIWNTVVYEAAQAWAFAILGSASQRSKEISP